MALSSLSVRRALRRSYLFRSCGLFSTVPNSPSSSSFSSHKPLISPSPNVFQSYSLHFPINFVRIQGHSFHSSSLSLSASRSYNDDDKISPDTILFEGCDYNHWLITMEFPKDPKPTPEEMVETYVQTLAKVVGSVEEAKKRMYACSTTTYNGFQAVMTEEMSEKFRGLPGVVFILPDSYIDPVNKEYGGDKYINGTIIPRPPPVQYGRQGRYGDRNRNYDRPRYDRLREPMPASQGNPPYDRQGSMQGDGRNYGSQQNYPPQQNYTPIGPGERRDSIPMGNRDYGAQQNYPPPQNYGPNAQGERRDSMPMGNRDYAPQGERRDPMPPYQRGYNQGERGNYFSQERRDFPQGERRDYAPPENRDFRGDNRNYAPPQGTGSGYSQNYPVHGDGARFPQSEQRPGMQGEHWDVVPGGQTGADQERIISMGSRDEPRRN